MAAFLCGIASCTTKKNTFFYRAYHGTTTRFNIYFNGNESYKEAVEIIDNSVKDNYTAILPIFPRPPKIDALKESPKLDRSIEKCSKAIKKHSMYIRGVEHCKPIPDCYLLMGKAYFQRQDFGDAMSVFSYIIHTHTNSKVWAEANTWKARTNLALNRNEEAEINLEEVRQPIENNKNKKYKLHWETTYAELLLTQKNYEQAILSLSEALTYKNKMKKDFRTRIHFILGQTYQKLGQLHNAAENYEIVLKRNPAYEMNFNAIINLSLCGATDKKSKNTAREKLKKMLKDERNDTYKDQIFYALAQLDLKEEKTDDAIRNLEASVYWSVSNMYQKTVSALQLAELYFDRSQFIESKTYYDTVVSIIPSTFPNYEDIKARAAILRNLVENLMLIKTQDELQKLARMEEKERFAYIDSLIADYNKREKERIDDEKEKKELMERSEKRSTARQSGGTSGAWYFYNSTRVKLGMQEFRKIWGNRELADYWFLKDIEVFDFFSDNTAAETSNEEGENADEAAKAEAKAGAKSSDPRDRSYYLQNVPFTKEQMNASNELVASGLFNSGMIYGDDLYDYEKAVKQWEEFLVRFPEHKFVAPIYFQLYETYAYLKDMEKSDYYKNLILKHFPNSNYARIIQNPDYYKEVASKERESADFYVAVYEAYSKKNYANTVELATKGLEKYPFPILSPKFDYLKAISLSKIYGNDTLLTLLPEIIRNYPATEIDTAATDLLEVLKKKQQQTAQTITEDTSKKTQDTKPIYVYDSRAFHFVIILANNKEVKVDQLKGHLSNFNTEFFRLQKFDPIHSFHIDDITQMVTISKFDNKDKAMDYYNMLKQDTKYVGYLKTTPSTKIYVISDANYTTFFHQKNKRSLYDDFFKENYLK